MDGLSGIAASNDHIFTVLGPGQKPRDAVVLRSARLSVISEGASAWPQSMVLGRAGSILLQVGAMRVPGSYRVAEGSGGNSKASRLLDSLLAPQRVSAAR